MWKSPRAILALDRFFFIIKMIQKFKKAVQTRVVILIRRWAATVLVKTSPKKVHQPGNESNVIHNVFPSSKHVITTLFVYGGA